MLQDEIELTRILNNQSDGLNPLKISQTRWSERAEACQKLSQWWDEIIFTLKYIERNQTQKAKTKC